MKIANRAVVIGALGAFALSALMTAQRRKEIGVRKVLGASTASLTALLSRDSLLLVLAGAVVAWPGAYWAMTRWLDDFAYRIELAGGFTIMPGLMVLMMVGASVIYQVLRAAQTQPADVLRDE